MVLGDRWRSMILCLLLLPPGILGLDLKTAAKWEYAIGDHGQVLADVDSLRFAPLPRMDELERLLPGGIGFLWIRAVFRLPADLMDKDPGLLSGAGIGADELYFNRRKIGDGGRFPPNFFSDWNDVRLWRIEPRSDSGADTLLIRLYVHHEGMIGDVVEIGPMGDLEGKQTTARFFAKETNLAMSILLFMIALHHILIFARRPKDVYHRNYALMCVSFASYLTNFFAPSIPGFVDSGISYLLFQKFVFVSMNLSVFSMGLFVSHYIRRNDPEWFRHLYALLFALIALLYLGAPDLGVFHWLRPRLGCALFIPVVYTLYVLGEGLVHRRPGARTILLGFTPLFFAFFHDMIVRFYMGIPGMYLTGFGAPIFIVAILFILSLRFVHNANEIERLNHELELEVVLRTNQLKEANLHLERSMIELKHSNRRLEELVVTDPLTRTLNRRAFDLRFEEEFLRSRRNRSPLSVLMVDIDYFKKVNDVHGHMCGDQCLSVVASELQSSLKRSADVLARYGGEEFVVLLPDTDSQGAARIAETLRTVVEMLEIPYEDKVLHLTISVGVASVVPTTELERGVLLGRADAALYEAKARGRNQVVVSGDSEPDFTL